MLATHNFMLSDWAAISAGFCLFALVGFIPGYALGWMLDVLRFRERTLSFRLALSVPLSIALGPILSYLIGRWLSMGAVWAVYGLLDIYALFLMVRTLKGSRPLPSLSKARLQVLGLVFVWMIIAVLMLADLQIGGRLYYSIIAFDYCVRTAFTNAISTLGLPAQNPFFFPGHPVALRYHYFWLILCALVHQISGSLVDARQALIAGTMWCGIGLICLVALYLRLFSPNASNGLARRTIIGISLLGVTGLDILPALLMLWLAHKGLIGGISPSVEWWNNQVDGWLYTMLWEPHYMASLVACLTGFLIIWDAPRAGRRWLISGIAAGLAFATAVGAGIYVAFVFAIFLTVWTLITLAKKWYRETAVLTLAGIVACVLSIPYLTSLRSPGSGGPLFQFTVRSFELGELLLKFLRIDRPRTILVANSLFLPLNYFLELGFFFSVGLLVWKAFRIQEKAATRHQLAAFTMAGTSVVVCTFLRSGVIANNDLGWRGFLIAQFMLLIWAADFLSTRPSGGHRRSLLILLIVGVMGVVYDLAILRFFPVWSDAGRVPKIDWVANDEKLGKRTYANREAYEWLRARTPARAVIQQNPGTPLQDTFYGLYGNRQTVSEDTTCGTTFGGDPRECVAIMDRLTGLFSTGGDSSLPVFDAACEHLPIDIVVAKDTDQVWNDRSSWVWTRPPIFANDFVRLFACHK